MKVSSRCLRMLMPAVLVGALAVGCSDDDDDDDDDGVRDGGAQDAGIDSGLDGGGDGGARDGGLDAGDAAITLNENQIVGVAAAANEGEILTSNVARAKPAQNGQVLAFAQMMIDMHTLAQTRQTGVANAAGLSIAESPIRTMMRSSAQATVTTLTGLPAGASFDLTYMQAQVSMHEMTLETIDEVLLPNATTPALRAELTTSRAEVVMHLGQARTIVSALGGGTDAGTDGGT